MTTDNTVNRYVVLDTETTGMPVTDGHRIIEIGCVELLGRRLTGRHFHVYLNPDREIDEGAIAVHGITNEYVADKPRFREVADEFYEFIKGAQLIIHNAAFDVGFINNEFALLGQSERADVSDYCSVLDTLMMARERHPGQRNSLDALCKRYGVDNSNRELHGALLDSEILADVYLAMTGGQTNLSLAGKVPTVTAAVASRLRQFVVWMLPARVPASFGPAKMSWRHIWGAWLPSKSPAAARRSGLSWKRHRNNRTAQLRPFVIA